MVDDPQSDSPLEAAAGAAGERATEAFSILGNETRLSTLLALWEAYDPSAEDNVVPFSDLRERLGNPDSGQFNYHLGELDGHFIRKTDDGYELRRAGRHLVQTVIAGTGIEEQTIPPTEIDQDCSRCGSPTAVTYQDRRIYLTCTECEGRWEADNTEPSGILAAANFHPAGLIERTPVESWDAKLTEMKCRDLSMVEGVCDVCSGSVNISLSICEDHAPEGICDNCGREWAVIADIRCQVCKNAVFGPPYVFVIRHPEIIGFFNQHGMPLQYESHGFYWEGLNEAVEQELVSDDPQRVRVSFQYEGDRLEALVDEELNVLEVTELD